VEVPARRPPRVPWGDEPAIGGHYSLLLGDRQCTFDVARPLGAGKASSEAATRGVAVVQSRLGRSLVRPLSLRTAEKLRGSGGRNRQMCGRCDAIRPRIDREHDAVRAALSLFLLTGKALAHL